MERKLTISEKMQQRRWNYARVPELRLAGKWFESAGFNTGDVVNVEVKEGKLIITNEKTPASKS